MNLNGIVAPLCAAITPNEIISIKPSTGSTTQADGKRVPTYGDPTSLKVAVQALSYNDIVQCENLNIQGLKCAIYLPGDWEGIVRADQKGGDLIVRANGSTWLVAMILEDWPDWTKVAAVMQIDTP